MRPRLISLLAAVLLTAVGVFHGSASAVPPGQECDFYASTAGIVGNDGRSIDQPFATVQQLVDAVGPTDIGCLRGTGASQPFTFEQLDVGSSGGSESGRITIKSFPGEIAKLSGRIVFGTSSSFITFSDLVLDGSPAGGTGIRVDGHDIHFSDNNVTNSSGTCFRVGVSAISSYTKFFRNRIHDCLFDAINGANTQGLILQNNVVYGNGAWGVKLTPNAQSSYVYRNIFDGNGGGVFFGANATMASSSNMVDSNIIAYSTMNNNVGYTWTNSAFIPSVNWVWRDCLYSPRHSNGGLQTSPQPQGYTTYQPLVVAPPGPGDPIVYQDRSTHDFHISSDSPCFELTGDLAAEQEAGGGPTDEQASANNEKPNILFIVTDDQRAEGTIIPDAMPQTIDRMRDRGTGFTNAFATTPLCCPSRSTIFSGRYAHNHLVTRNGLFRPSARNLDENATLQRYLHDDVYRTAVFGKFLYEWDLDMDPRHWDSWAISNRGYCPLDVNDNGTRTFLGDPNSFANPCPPDPYGTNYIRDKAIAFINQREQSEAEDSEPWFMYVAPSAPHGPYVPEQEHAGATFPPIPYNQSEAQQEGEPGHDPIDDKPEWVRRATGDPTLFDDNPTPGQPNGRRVQQLRTLKSVDNLVKGIIDELEAKGEQDTLIVYVSDNGFAWNEHRLVSKNFPYTDSIKVPFLMRYAPYTMPGATDPRLVGNVDLASTALDAAGLSLTRDPELDGTSLLAPGPGRDRMLTEGWGREPLQAELPAGIEWPTPNWASTRTVHYQYIENYADDGVSITFREYYDLDNDPEQLENLYGTDGIPGNSDDTGTPPESPTFLHDQLMADRLCQGTECPPGNGASSLQDTHDPLVYLDVPSQNASVCCRVKLEADAYDNLGVEEVRFKVNGGLVDTDANPPFEGFWDATGLPQGQYLVEAEAVDADDSRSTISTVNLDGSDFQAQNCAGSDCPAGRINSQDTIIYKFASPVSPDSFWLGWDGNPPADCSPTPQPPGCATVDVKGDLRIVLTDSDTLSVHRDVAGTADQITQLGAVDLDDDNYVGYGTLRTWSHSPADLSDDGRRLVITLGTGGLGTTGTISGNTARWTNPFCGCQVFESAQATGEDRDF